MREMVCIVCPNGCKLRVEGEGENLTVSGNKCKRGLQFAESEVRCPMRTICSTVKTAFAAVPVLPVRVSADIPKERIFDVMDAINAALVTAPVKRGEPVIKNVLNLGVDVIATSNVLFDAVKEEQQ